MPSAAWNPCKLAVAVCALLHAPATWAGRPFTTEDAGVIAAGACELETFGAQARASADPSDRGGWGQVGCGIGFDTQLAVGAGRFRSGAGSRTVAAVIGKTALRPLADDGFGVSLSYALDGVRHPGEPMQHAGSQASLVVTVPLGRTLVHANLGVSRSYLEGRTQKLYAVAIERLGEQGLDVGIEIFGQGRESPWIGTGARYAVNPEKLWVDFSFAVQSDRTEARQLTVGLKYAF